MIALDTSVVVACFGAWHEDHAIARSILAEDPRLPAHTGLEAYSVLTRLSPPFRAEPPVVAEFLDRTSPTGRLVLAAGEHAGLPGRLAGLGLAGVAVYDALTAVTAASAGVEIATLDRRAASTYERCGVRARMLI